MERKKEERNAVYSSKQRGAPVKVYEVASKRASEPDLLKQMPSGQCLDLECMLTSELDTRTHRGVCPQLRSAFLTINPGLYKSAEVGEITQCASTASALKKKKEMQ